MIKRVIDVILGSILAIAATPVILVLAVAMAIQFRAWPFFTQDRVGLAGRLFRIVKLRTLPVETPRYADKYTLHADALPPLPRLLRAMHLDELPQLWLVPLGRMTLVGPRPEMPFLHDRLPAEAVAIRNSVRPGCTGLWQISAAAPGLIHEHPEYDLLYVAHQGLRLDAWILWRTALLLAGVVQPVRMDTMPALVAPRHPHLDTLRAEHQPAG